MHLLSYINRSFAKLSNETGIWPVNLLKLKSLQWNIYKLMKSHEKDKISSGK
jgi:hypothetical protein